MGVHGDFTGGGEIVMGSAFVANGGGGDDEVADGEVGIEDACASDDDDFGDAVGVEAFEVGGGIGGAELSGDDDDRVGVCGLVDGEVDDFSGEYGYLGEAILV